MLPLGTQAPGFTLPDTSGTMAGRDDFTARCYYGSRNATNPARMLLVVECVAPLTG